MIRPPSAGIRQATGFTLVETLVALAIVAIALTAGLQATGALTRLSKTLPGVGNSSETCQQAGHDMEVSVDVLPTPNPNFRRVDVRVNTRQTALALQAPEVTTLLLVSTVVGRF
jgi:general secretion pathway protein I